MSSIPGSSFSFYNANAATVQFSMAQGGSGFSGICANFYPQLVSWLCANPDHELAGELQTFMAVAENVVMYKYPRSAKVFLGMFEGCGITEVCRLPNPPDLNEEERLKLEALHRMAAQWSQKLGIARLSPGTGAAATEVPNSLA